MPAFIDKLISSVLKDKYGSKIKTQLNQALDKAIYKELARIKTHTKLKNEIYDTGLELVYALA